MAQDEISEVLVLDAIETGSRTALSQKRRLLGRVVAQALTDSARIGPAQLIIAALRDTDAPHIRVLTRIEDARG